LKKQGVMYFMVSADKPEVNKRFAEKHGGSFPILSDPDKTLAKPYGAMMKAGFYKRWTFYIDKDGIITKIDKKVKPVSAGEGSLDFLKELNMDK
jgi:thioredoxin-dependent peroxiredoxin